VTDPIAVLLVGITGSGKTVLAQALAERGLIRLSVDEEVHRLHGRYGVTTPSTSTSSVNAVSSMPCAPSSPSAWPLATTLSWTTACGGARTARPGRSRGRTPAPGLPAGGEGGVATTP
jgi:hypothetical protein